MTPASSRLPVPVAPASTPPARPSWCAGRHVFLVGIGGCGVSGLAVMLQSLGATCRGSDRASTDRTRALRAAGIEVSFEQDAGRIPAACDLVVASAAIGEDHPELVTARTRSIEILSYAETLGRVQAESTGVSIAGTHGKSTTAAMLCHVLIEAGLDPGFIIGAHCPQIGGGARLGSRLVPHDGPFGGRPGLLVAEACEFDRSFHHHRPVLALITNVEEDHLDVYGSIDTIVQAFAAFARLLPAEGAGGRLLIAHDGAHRREITAGLSARVDTFGYNPAADYQVVADATARRVAVHHGAGRLAEWTNTLPGEHNALNAAAAAILAHDLGVAWDDVARALDGFRGIDRRLQRLGARPARGGTVTVYDDYGHHPTEIEKTLVALRAAERPRRLICVFQPHQHSRTRFLLEEFARSFAAADVVVVPHIYFVRDSEIERHRVSARDLVDRLRGRGITAMHLYPFEAIVEQLEIMCEDGDLLVVMGAGPVGTVGKTFLDRSPSPP